MRPEFIKELWKLTNHLDELLDCLTADPGTTIDYGKLKLRGTLHRVRNELKKDLPVKGPLGGEKKEVVE